MRTHLLLGGLTLIISLIVTVLWQVLIHYGNTGRLEVNLCEMRVAQNKYICKLFLCNWDQYSHEIGPSKAQGLDELMIVKTGPYYCQK